MKQREKRKVVEKEKEKKPYVNEEVLNKVDIGDVNGWSQDKLCNAA